MKRLLVMITVRVLTVLMLATLAACGGGTDPIPTPTPAASNGGVSTNDPTPAPVPDFDFDADRVIAVYTREDGSGTRDAFVSITGVGDDMYIEAVVLDATAQILTGVEGNEYAIGYVSVGSLSDAVKALEIDGVVPSNDTIKDGSYALQRPFLVVVNNDKIDDELVQDFIAFMMSKQGQEELGSTWTSDVDSPEDYTPSGLSGVLKVGGSTSVEPLMTRMRQAYLALNPDMEIEISGGGSGAGISEATDGVIDIGMSSRNLRDTEQHLNSFTIALDGVAVIVNIVNPTNGLSIEQVKEIFTGDITKWSALN